MVCFGVLLSFSKSLACDQTKCLFLNDDTWIIRSDLLLLKWILMLKHYPFMINLNKCTGNCNVLSPKICVPKEIKEKYVKVFTTITNKAEAKAVREHFMWLKMQMQ